MRLERLEISGFKSFSERSELAFDEGVTAIVGPNGCGKSNVADAITWVLGEQSAKSLRGEKMEDIIFNGSDARKPGAAAEVRLRLSGLMSSRRGLEALPAHDVPALREFRVLAPDHGHGAANGNGHAPDAEVFEDLEVLGRDVEVTRRLYRSGESEYLIDGEACRLRDVHELLMDTGLGAKAYAIIEQGKIGLILSSRPADRRQLIEEAAGITKYKSRRRAAELKLEAAQQNLTRIDDIVFEVDKQRGALKRQAAKARRYRRLRDELRRWEKVLFARRYRELAHDLEAARSRLAGTREREAAASVRVAAVDADVSRLRIEQAEADARAARVRNEAHARELDINRRQQQQTFDRHQTESLAARAVEIEAEVRDLEARREPARLALEAQRQAFGEAGRSRDEAAAVAGLAAEEVARAQQAIETCESDVDRARSEAYAVQSSAAALQHAVQHAGAQRMRVVEALAKLDVETSDLWRERDAVRADRAAATAALERARASLGSLRLDRATRESTLAVARQEHESATREVRTREQELAAVEGRLASLEELAATRADFGDAARTVLVQADERVGQQGAVADYVEVDSRCERAVEACLGDLLQHVIVERHDQAAAGLALVREHGAGRCGFVVVDPASNGYHPRDVLRAPGVVPVSDVVRLQGPFAESIARVLPEAYVVESFEQAVEFSRQTPAPVATLDGDVFRGPHLVSGGTGVSSRGILATRREIKELRARVAADRAALTRLADEVTRLEVLIAGAIGAIAALQAEQHRQEMASVGFEAQLARAEEDDARLARKAEVIALERRQAEEERAALDERRTEAEASLVRLEEDRLRADEQLAESQRRLTGVRETVADLGARAAEARASHAALVERASALAADVGRLEASAGELEERVDARGREAAQTRARREELLAAIAESERTLDADLVVLETLRADVRASDEAAADVRIRVDAQDAVIREARQALEAVRGEASALEVARATAENELSHLARTCTDTVQASLDAVLAEVEQMELAGEPTPDAAASAANEPDPDAEDGEAAPDEPPPPASMTAEEAMARLKAKIDRLGPVNMMAIEQFDELEQRHLFLTTQRQDLVESIAQTAEAIERIDETTMVRFRDAFTAIQANFQETFGTLFGGGRASLTLVDDNDPLESGIDIVASPPGKRLQSVQLLSGGEKALTAIALMFAIFRYKPSPFCLLDEIDAPLDDANISRFVEMLRGMLDRTQFILITHNRRTMEIANRLYGVTMEEPGVSKLISVQLH